VTIRAARVSSRPPGDEQGRRVRDLQSGDEGDQPLGDHQPPGGVVGAPQPREAAQADESPAHHDEQDGEDRATTGHAIRAGEQREHEHAQDRRDEAGGGDAGHAEARARPDGDRGLHARPDHRPRGAPRR
jgi:hypothetical protein